MKRKWLMAIVAMAVISIGSCDRAEKRTAPGSSESAEKNPELAGQMAASPGDAPEVKEENPRTRPSQPPVEREYAKPKPPEIPMAVAVEGRPGYVTSPFNAKVIDVRDIPPGTLVADPTFPTEEKKFFRVPPAGN